MKKFFIFAAAICAAMTAQAATNLQSECGSTIYIKATAKTGYHFTQWTDGNKDNPRAIDVTGDSSYYAEFDANKYRIVFKGDQDAELFVDSVAYGDTPVYGGLTPTKTATAQYTYTFDGWNPNISVVEGDQTYTAMFSSVVNEYAVTFKNYDGTVLQSSNVAYGQTPVYKGATPTKPKTAQYTYTFKGWKGGIGTVTGVASYVAEYDSIVNSYTVTLSGTNCEVKGAGTYTYGTEVQISATPKDCYHFTQWSDKDENATRTIVITGDVNLTATVEVNMYNIRVYSTDETKGEAEVYNK